MGAGLLWWNGKIHETSVCTAPLQVCPQVPVLVLWGALLPDAAQLRLAWPLALRSLRPAPGPAEGRRDLR